MKRIEIFIALAFLTAARLHAQNCPRIQQRGDTLFADPRDAESYRWYKNGVIIPAQTGNFIFMDESAEYSVEVFATSPYHVYSVSDSCSDPVCLTWVRTPRTSTPDNRGWAVDAHPDGSVTVAGSFRGPLILGGDTVSGSNPSYDMFLARFDDAGNVLWLRGVLGNNQNVVEPRDVAAHADGSATVTGKFTGTVDFGGIVLTSVGGPDIFVVRYDAGGNVVWARRAGGNHPEDADIGMGIAAHADGSVTVTGAFVDTADFGGIKLIPIAPTPGQNIFLVRYNSAGDVLWANRAGSPGSENWGSDVVVHSDGMVSCTGVVGGDSAYFEGSSLNYLLIESTGHSISGIRNGFLARYDSSGNIIGVNRVAATDEDEFCNGLATHHPSGTVVAGTFLGVARFVGLDSTTVFEARGLMDMFVARYNDDGHASWARRAGGNALYGSFAEAHRVATWPDGSIVVTGEFRDTLDFGGGVRLVSAGITDMFVACYSSSGNVLWARRGGGTYLDAGHGVATHANGAATITGYFSGTVDFDNRIITATANPHESAVFVARLTGP